MNDIARARLLRFQQAASTGQVIVRTHFKPDPDPALVASQDRFKKQILVGVAALAAGVALTGYVASGPATQESQADIQPSQFTRLARGEVTSTPKGTVQRRQVAEAPAAVSKIKLVPITYDGKAYETISAASRLALVKEAAKSEGLDKVGLNWRDLYGVIHAETSWVSRVGQGKNGVRSDGLAQFEPASAKAYGIKNPSDPSQAVHGSAKVLREAAVWAAKRADEFNVPMLRRAQSIRDGVTVYYNLSWKARHEWRPMRNNALPDATIAHMDNVRQGVEIARRLEKARRSGEKLELEKISIAVAQAAQATPPALAKSTKNTHAVVKATALTSSTRAKGYLVQMALASTEPTKKRKASPG